MPLAKKTGIVAIALIIFNVLFFWIKPEGRAMTVVCDLLPLIGALAALAGTALAVKSFGLVDRPKLAWILLLSGMILFSGAEAIYGVLEVILNVDVRDGFPILADYFRMAACLPVLTGLAMLVLGYKKSRFNFGRKRNVVFTWTALALVAVALVHQLLLPILQDAATGLPAKSAYLYYFATGLLVLVPAAFLMHISSLYRRSLLLRPWRYMAAGLLCVMVFTILHTYLSWNNMYSQGNFLEILRTAGYLLVGLSGLHQKELHASV